MRTSQSSKDVWRIKDSSAVDVLSHAQKRVEADAAWDVRTEAMRKSSGVVAYTGIRPAFAKP